MNRGALFGFLKIERFLHNGVSLRNPLSFQVSFKVFARRLGLFQGRLLGALMLSLEPEPKPLATTSIQ